MSNFKRSLGGLIAASLVFAMVSGCGGAGSANNGAPPNQTVPLKGGFTTNTATNPTTVTASPNPQTIAVTPPGSTTPINVQIPAGISVPAGAPLAIITTGTTFFQNMIGGSRTTPTAGSITINNQATGVTIYNGTLSGNIGIPAGHYTVTCYGPFSVYNNNGGNQVLTLGKMIFTFDCNGAQLSLPNTVSGTLPINGSSLYGDTITATFPSNYTTGSASLALVGTNGNLSQTRPLVGGSVAFSDLSGGDVTLDTVPAQGYVSLAFGH